MGGKFTAPRFPPPAVRRDRGLANPSLVRCARFMLSGRPAFRRLPQHQAFSLGPLVRTDLGFRT